MNWTDVLKRQATLEEWNAWKARQKKVHSWHGVKEDVEQFSRQTGMQAPPEIITELRQERARKKPQVKDIFNLDRSEKVEKTARNDHRSDKEIIEYFHTMHNKYMEHEERTTPEYKTGTVGKISQKYIDYQEHLASILKDLGKAASDYSRMITDDLSDSPRRTANDTRRRFSPKIPKLDTHRGKER